METEILKVEIKGIRTDIAEIRGAFTKVADALERLARLEERDRFAGDTLKEVSQKLANLDLRLHEIEKNEPMQTLTSGWMVNAVWAGAGMIAVFAAKKLGLM